MECKPIPIPISLLFSQAFTSILFIEEQSMDYEMQIKKKERKNKWMKIMWKNTVFVFFKGYNSKATCIIQHEMVSG